VDDVTWGALALVLTALGGLYTWWAFTRRGAAPGTRGAALTLLPAAAWLTGTLEMFSEIGGSIADWATGLVFSPAVWLGIALAGTSVALMLLATRLPSRRRESRRSTPAADPGRERRALPEGRPPSSAPVVDDDMAEIEAILKRRGIS
jgi:hypothetical protein